MHSRAWTALAVLSLAAPARAQQAQRCPDLGDARALLRCAQDRSVVVLQAEQELEGVRARRAAAGQVLPSNPTLEVSVGRRKVHSGATDLDRGVLLTQTFEVGGQRSLRLGVADAEERAAQLAVSGARRDLAAEVLGAVGAVWLARAEVAFAADARRAATQLTEIARARLTQGQGSGLDVELAEAAGIRAGQDQRRAAVALRQAEAQLALAVGADVRLAPDAALPAPRLQAASLAALERSALEGRLEVQARAADAEVGRAQVALLRRERIPDLTLGGYLRHEELAQIIGGTLSFSLPLLTQNKSALAEQEARVRKAQTARGLAELQVRLEVRAAFEAREQTRAALREVPADLGARLAADLAALQRAYQGGSLPLMSVLAQLREVFAARITLAQLHSDALGAELQLARAAALPLDLSSGGTP